jgi:DNA-binding NarL/FixJ family response regulator
MSSQSILVVDDEQHALELLARGLVRLGYQVTAVNDGAEAIPLLSQAWDVIVTDLVMPQVDGVQLLSEINRHCPTAQRVVITSFADKERVIAVLNLGADYLLEKPFSVARLASVIERLQQDRKNNSDQLIQFFHRRLLGLAISPRERELVGLVLQGLANKEIAQRLGLSEQTVKNTLSSAYLRLGVTNRSGLFHVVFPI